MNKKMLKPNITKTKFHKNPTYKNVSLLINTTKIYHQATNDIRLIIKTINHAQIQATTMFDWSYIQPTMDNPNNNIAFIITTTNNAQQQLTTNVGLMVNTINNKQQTTDQQPHQIDHR
jgi:hypothetical protein